MTAPLQDVARYCADLRQRLVAALSKCVGSRDVVLIDAAAYANPGDCAITVGTLALLHDIDVEVRQVADRRHFSADALGRALGSETTILLQGGGNLGDTWPSNQSLRELVIESYPDHRIVQLPQSVAFAEGAAVERFRRVLTGHGGVQVMVRDRTSATAVVELFDVRPDLVPDMAFANPPTVARAPGATVARGYVRRSDRESIETTALAPPADWPSDRHLALHSFPFAWRLLAERATRAPGVEKLDLSHSMGRALVRGLAKARLRSSVQWLSKFEVIVTDRLHGHILATLMGIPHVVVNNSNGKVFAFDETWPGLSNSFVGRSPSWDPGAIDQAVRSLEVAPRDE